MTINIPDFKENKENYFASIFIGIVIIATIVLFIVFYNVYNSNLIFYYYLISIPANLGITLIISAFLVIRTYQLSKERYNENSTLLTEMPKEFFEKFFFLKTDTALLTEAKLRATASCRLFLNFFTFTFIILFILYLFKSCFTISDLINGKKELKEGWFQNSVSSIFDIVSTFILSLCLIILSEDTFKLKNVPIVDNESKIRQILKFHPPKILYWCFIPIAAILITSVILLLIFHTFNTDNTEVLNYYNFFISLSIGLFSYFVFSRFTSRIDSKFIKVRGIIVFLFFIYACTLIYFPLSETMLQLPEHQNSMPLYVFNIILLYISFILKAVISFFIIGLFNTDQMLIYFLRMNSVQKELRNQDIAIFNFFKNWTSSKKEKIIETIIPTITNSNNMKKIFLSYASEDKEDVKKIVDYLTEKEINIWFDQWCILPGDSITKKISDAMKECEFFLPVLSNNFLSKSFPMKEFWAAVMKHSSIEGKYIIPVLIEKCEIPDIIKDIAYANLFENFEENLNKLILSIEKN